jgi:hypothetical protein
MSGIMLRIRTRKPNRDISGSMQSIWVTKSGVAQLQWLAAICSQSGLAGVLGSSKKNVLPLLNSNSCKALVLQNWSQLM